MRIVPIAVKEYFVNGKSIPETIKNHKDIYDFCMRLKINSTSKGVFTHFKDGTFEITADPLQRTTRYYIGTGKQSGVLKKIYSSGSESGVNVGFSAILFNNFEEKPMKDYNINYNFYISEAYKLKNAVETGQLTLF